MNSSFGTGAQTVNTEAVTIGTYNSTTGELIITVDDGSANAATMEQLIESIRYNNSSNTPNTTVRSITFTATDNDNNVGLTSTANVSVTAINSTPILNTPQNVSVTALASTPITGISFSDIDSTSLTVTLSVDKGTLSATSSNGVNVSNAGTSAMTLSGSINDLNTFVSDNHVTFVSASNSTTTVTLSVSASDGSSSPSSTITLDITAVPQPSTPTTPTTPDPEPETTVDGVIIETTVEENGSETLTIPIVEEERVEDTQTPTTTHADIPLITNDQGEAQLSVGVPTDVGITVEGHDEPISKIKAFSDLIQRIEETTTDGSDTQQEQTQEGQSFLNSLNPSDTLIVKTITPSVSENVSSVQPILIRREQLANDNEPDEEQKIALVIDVSHLPSGSVLQLDNIDFVSIVGAVRVIGGEGENIAIGDNNEQYIVLGADDDELHGGGGNDIIGSKDGNDLLYGDEGDDLVVGGDGDDELSGGVGNDILQGGRSDSGLWSFQLDTQGVLLSSFTADEEELAITASLITHFNTFEEDQATPRIDARLAFTQQDTVIVETTALLFQAILDRLPTTEEMNTFATQDMSQQALAQLAYDYYVSLIGELGTSTAEQVNQLVSWVWGSQAATDNIIQVGTDFIDQGGSWADGLLYLALHDELRSTLLDTASNLTVTQDLELGETGWSGVMGNDILDGGEGDDILIGGFGSDILDGGSGIDTARQAGNLNDYQFLIDQEGILKLRAGEDTDSLLGVEFVEFGDQTVTTSASNQQSDALRKAAILSDLITNGTTQLSALNAFTDQEQTLLELAQSQMNSEGYLSTWNTENDTAFIQHLSEEVLGTSLTGNDLQYWVNQLDSGLTREETFVAAVGVVDTSDYLGAGIMLGTSTE